MNLILCKCCGHPMAPGAAFCAKCGAPAPAPVKLTFCGHCGNPMTPGAAFCARCGTQTIAPASVAPVAPTAPVVPAAPAIEPVQSPALSAEPLPAAEVPETITSSETAPAEPTEVAEHASTTLEPSLEETPAPEMQDAPAVAPIPSAKPRRKRPVWARILCGFGSSILLTIAIVIGLAAGTILMVRDIVSTDSIREMISDIDLTTMEIEVEGETQTVSDAIHDAFKEAQNDGAQAINPDSIDELLKADFVVDFMATTVGSYAEAITDGTEVKDLSAEEISSFLTDHRTEIEEILDVELTDETIQNITAELEETQVLEQLSVSNVIGESSEITTVTQFFSQEAALIACAAMLLCLLLIALVNFFRPISLSYAGAAFLSVGGIFGLIALLLEGLITLLAEVFGIPVSILDFAIGSIASAAFNVFLIGAIGGLLFIAGAIVYTVIRSARRAKLEA